MRVTDAIPIRAVAWLPALLLSLPAFLASSSGPARAAVASPPLAQAFAGGAYVVVGAGYRSHRPHYYHRPYYRPYWRPYSYPWYGWGGYWPGPPPRRIYVVDRPGFGVVETDVRPKKAEVKLDGRSVGQARDYNGRWDRLGLAPGRHTIEFSAPEHKTLSIEFDIEPGGYYRFERRLEKGHGEDPGSVRLPAPSDESEAVADTDPSGTPARGFLRLRVQPSDAVVYLDGAFLAVGDELARLHGALPVAAGRHLVQVVRPGHETATVEVEIPRDGSETLSIELEPESEPE